MNSPKSPAKYGVGDRVASGRLEAGLRGRQPVLASYNAAVAVEQARRREPDDFENRSSWYSRVPAIWSIREHCIRWLCLSTLLPAVFQLLR